jgi:CRISPR/Cas system-associated endonuclease Cas1
MEEFRAQIVDSFVGYLVNKKILTPEDFTPPDERGGVYLQASALKNISSTGRKSYKPRRRILTRVTRLVIVAALSYRCGSILLV